ncbi:MAG TPA: Gfo/Idh/MocA family oxidoreductase [Candidatus Binataceae bacterium]|nr:Gfo/Idh/MocA family oxidoreductase [Candidatus Binataceae bacterium]
MTLQTLTQNGAAVRPAQRDEQRGPRLRGIAVIGLGYWGPNWVRNLYQMQCAQRLVCCDFSRQRLEHIKALYPAVETTSQTDDVLRDPDIEAVIIATPVSTHFDIARRALMAGKSALIEKPLATSACEASQLVALARERELTLMVGHTFEYSAPVLKIREIIQSGELGDIFYVSSVRANLGLFQRDVNVTWDLATHDISIILMLLGRMPLEVSCHGQSHYRKEVEDVAMLTLRFPNNVIAFVHVSWLDPNKIRRATIVGSRKMLVYDDTALQEKIRVYDKGVTMSPYYDTYGDFQMSYRYGDVHIPRIEEPEPLKVECEHFVDCIAKGASPRTDGQNGLRVVSVLEASERSLRNGGRFMPVIQGAID